MHHLLKENLALCTHRSLRSATMYGSTYLLAIAGITEGNCISNKDGPHTCIPTLPISRYRRINSLRQNAKLNFKPDFLTALSESLGLPQTAPLKLPEGVSPEEILGYIYAVLYSPTYRDRYYEFLKYDFPRIPFTAGY